MAIVTVSRRLGGWGDLIARRLADRLGVRCVDQQAMVAEVYRYGLSTSDAFVPEMQERKPTLLQRFDEERHRHNVLLRAIVYDLANQGDVVFIGLGSQVLLAGIRHVVRSSVTAPLALRVERVMEHEGIDRNAALAMVRTSDRDRAGYLQYLHSVEWTRPDLYDVVINTERTDVDSAVELLAHLTEQPEFASTAESQAFLADRALASRVEVRLVTNPQVVIDSLEVTADHGRVTLRGLVFTEEERELAEQIVSQTPGVSWVDSDLRLKPMPAPFP